MSKIGHFFIALFYTLNQEWWDFWDYGRLSWLSGSILLAFLLGLYVLIAGRLV